MPYKVRNPSENDAPWLLGPEVALGLILGGATLIDGFVLFGNGMLQLWAATFCLWGILSQPVALSAWAIAGGNRASWRWVLANIVVSILCMLKLLALVYLRAFSVENATLVTCAVYTQFGIPLAAAWLSRNASGPDRHSSERGWQFGLKQLFGWTIAAAVLAAGWRILLPELDFTWERLAWSIVSPWICAIISVGILSTLCASWLVQLRTWSNTASYKKWSLFGLALTVTLPGAFQWPWLLALLLFAVPMHSLALLVILALAEAVGWHIWGNASPEDRLRTSER